MATPGTKVGLLLPSAVFAHCQADTSLTPLTSLVASDYATFTLTIDTGEDDVGFAELGGVTDDLTVTWATSDEATCTALAVALNALATVNIYFSFAAVDNTVVVTSLMPGTAGNAYTATGDGTGVTPATSTAFSGATNPTGGGYYGAFGDINRLFQVLGNRYSWNTGS